MKQLVFFVDLWTLVLGSSLFGYSASAEEIISIYRIPKCGDDEMRAKHAKFKII